MIHALIVAASATAAPPPTPQQYYSQALATMQRLSEPAEVSFETHLTARGLGMSEPCSKGKIQWAFGWGSGLSHRELAWNATYSSASALETIRADGGQTCRGPAETFDRPTWRDADAWIRYGMFSQAPDAATPPATHADSTTLKTIATVSVIAPGAYRITDGGSQSCPSGSAGHALHFMPRFDAEKHPLRDAIVETQTMRICMIRFDLGSYQAAGTGFRGDMRLDFGDVDGNWIVTRGHAAMALRAVGISLKNVALDFWYSDITFPQPSS